MRLWHSFWRDECGALVSAELITVATVGVLGGTVGLNMLGTSVNGEFRELSHAVRSLNQSYTVSGFSSCRAWTAGSEYIQPNAQQSIADLDAAFVGDLAQPEPEQKPDAKQEKKKGAKGAKKKSKPADDEAAFVVPDESSLGEADKVEAEDDASRVETTIEPNPEA